MDPFPLSPPFSEIFALVEYKHEKVMACKRRMMAGAPAVCIIDGNQKLTRRTCAELMASVKEIPGTDLKYYQDCSMSPANGSSFCNRHKRVNMRFLAYK